MSAPNMTMSRGTLGDVVFCLQNGDITKQEVDVVVNTTNCNLDLMNGGGVSQAIGRVGGNRLQTECKTKYSGGIRPGDVAITGVHLLPAFQAIYHVFLSHWGSKSSDALKKELKTLIRNILQAASDNKADSIAIPAIGSGANQYPADLVADAILAEVTEYCDVHQNTSIRKVIFVVHVSNQSVITAFEKKFSDIPLQMQSSQQPAYLGHTRQCTSAFMVGLSGAEYNQVRDNVKKTAQGRINYIVKIERVVNASLKERYEAYKRSVAAPINERNLFHGTKESCLRGIKERGFDRGLLGSNMSTVFGHGHGFAVNSWYSLSPSFSQPDANGNRYLFQCKVITGKHAKGSSGMTAPPAGYQSTVDDVSNPTLFVVYNDDAIYPEFLITFK